MHFDITCTCSSWHNSLYIAPFHACNISKCSPRDALHFVQLHHVHLRPYWCPNLWCKSASCCCLLLLSRTWRFVIFVSFNLCILWAWALHVFCCMPCYLYRGVCHVFLWSLWWLAQACKLGPVIFLISGTWWFLKVLVRCNFVAM